MRIDIVIIGAGASGLMCAIEAAKRGRSVYVLEHANRVGKKILMSGGGRCNFTNYQATPAQFESSNPHFCKSALARYLPSDFIELVESHSIPYHEKTLGQLFCDRKSQDIVDMLLAECEQYGVTILTSTPVKSYEKKSSGEFVIKTPSQAIQCESLVVATGGLSIPTLGATGFGYEIAEHFGLSVLPRCAGLVPFCLSEKDKAKYSVLSGVSFDAVVWSDRKQFREAVLFTHRGISGPAILQISSYWQPGESVFVDCLPDFDLQSELLSQKQAAPKVRLKTILEPLLPKRMLAVFFDEATLSTSLADCSHERLASISACLKQWTIKPVATEGYRTAEVTIGGVDPNELSSKTFEAKKVPGLYFIGEVIDVNGWLGGYNFQWAWASGFAAGQVV